MVKNMKTLIKIRGYVGKRAYLVCFESDEKLRRYRMKCNQICLTLSNPRIHKSSHKDWQKAFNIRQGKMQYNKFARYG